MPLLECEPSVFPATLFERYEAGEGSRWVVLHTRPRSEKSLARAAVRMRVPFYLPLFVKRWRNKGRSFAAHVPLFPGYVFVHGDEDTCGRMVDTRHVANCIPVVDQKQLWKDLTQVFTVIQSGGSLHPRDRLAPGSMVLVTRGPWAGLEGKILRSGGGLVLVVEVQFLQRGVAVEIESWMVESLGEVRSEE